MSNKVEDTFFEILSQHLHSPVEQLRADCDKDLESLGLDSHLLMRVSLAIEEALAIEELHLDDQDLESPATLLAAVCRQAQRGSGRQ